MTRHSVFRQARDGYALLTVLWVIAGGATVALGAAGIARDAVRAARNRGAATRASWQVEGCIAAARAAIDAKLANRGEFVPATDSWSSVDSTVAITVAGSGCTSRSVTTGSSLDVTRSKRDEVSKALQTAGVTRSRADSVADAIVDWQDVNEMTGDGTTEASWYRTHNRVAPPNRPISDSRELDLVRDVDALEPAVRALLGIESGTVAINHAPVAILASLPGIPDGAAALLSQHRAVGVRFDNPATMLALLQVPGLHMSALLPRLSATPVGWDVEVAASQDGVTVRHTVRLVRADQRAAVVRRFVEP